MIRLIAIPLFLVVITTAYAADRPSAEEVAKAVQLSHAKYEDDHPTTKYVSELGKQITQLRRENGIEAKDKSPEERKKILAETSAAIQSVTARMNTAKKRMKTQTWDEYFFNFPLNVTDQAQEEMASNLFTNPRLARLDWESLQVGVVGWVGEEGPQENRSGRMRCVQRLPDGRWLGERVRYRLSYNGPVNAPGPAKPLSAKEYTQGIVLVSGVSADWTGRNIQEGVAYPLHFNAIVCDEYTYETTSGASKTVFVIEKFDPGVPFK